MKWVVTLTLLLSLTSGIAIAQQSSPAQERWSLLSLMHGFEKEFATLRPYLVSSAKFADPKSRSKIRGSIQELQTLIDADRPETIEKNPALNLNFSMLSYQVRGAARIFDQGGYEIARQDLNATMNLCVSCHTQVPISKSKLAGLWFDDESEPRTYENAEFLFVTRRFDLALKRFDELIRDYPKNGISPDQLNDALNRKVVVFARIRREPSTAITSFKRDLQNEKIPQDVRSNVTKWISYFEGWNGEKTKLESLPLPELMKAVRSSAPAEGRRLIAPADPELVKYLRLSGLVFEQLMKDPSGEFEQEMLYQLAILERAMGKLYPSPLSPSLLRECVLKHPKKPFTRKCYDLYEKVVNEQYAGFATPPDIVKSTLEAMKRNL